MNFSTVVNLYIKSYKMKIKSSNYMINYRSAFFNTVKLSLTKMLPNKLFLQHCAKLSGWYWNYRKISKRTFCEIAACGNQVIWENYFFSCFHILQLSFTRSLIIIGRQILLWLDGNPERFTPSTKLNPYLHSLKLLTST